MADGRQREMAEEIASYTSKKEYYDILGVPKTANQAEIKKAYRHLALRFHPDKNAMPGAVDVFKKITNAYSTLTNVQKKEYYDRYGPEEPRAAPAQYRNYARPGEDHQFQEFDDIFRAFFGHNMQHVRRQQGYQNVNPNERRQEQKNNIGFLMVFAIFFIIYNIAPLFRAKEPYSFYPSSQYRIRRATETFNVEYYVNNHFFQHAKQDRNYIKNVEKKADRQYIVQLQSTCDSSRQKKKAFQQYSYRERITSMKNYYAQQAKRIDLNSCRMLNEIIRGHQAYLREIKYF